MAILAPSLHRLFGEINARWPNRDRRTDGWYASPAVRISKGHNPGRGGYTHAIDVDDDGIDESFIINSIYKGGGILWYIIWNRTIWSNTYGWRPQYYSGPNPHYDHMHLEIYQTITAENFSGSWGISSARSGFGPAIPESGGGSGFGAAPGFDPAFADRDYRGHVQAAANYLQSGGNWSHDMAGLFRGLMR